MSNFREYIEIINYLQNQYAGSTSLSAWERFENHLNKLNEDKSELGEKIKEMNQQNHELALQQKSLKTQLESVEKLKDKLEQSFGKDDIEKLMEQFRIVTQRSITV